MFLGATRGIIMRKRLVVSTVANGIMFGFLGPVFYSVYTIPHLSNSGALGLGLQAYV